MNAPSRLYRVRFYGDEHDAPMSKVVESTSLSAAKEIVRRLYPGCRIVKCKAVGG